MDSALARREWRGKMIAPVASRQQRTPKGPRTRVQITSDTNMLKGAFNKITSKNKTLIISISWLNETHTLCRLFARALLFIAVCWGPFIKDDTVNNVLESSTSIKCIKNLLKRLMTLEKNVFKKPQLANLRLFVWQIN